MTFSLSVQQEIFNSNRFAWFHKFWTTQSSSWRCQGTLTALQVSPPSLTAQRFSNPRYGVLKNFQKWKHHYLNPKTTFSQNLNLLIFWWCNVSVIPAVADLEYIYNDCINLFYLRDMKFFAQKSYIKSSDLFSTWSFRSYGGVMRSYSQRLKIWLLNLTTQIFSVTSDPVSHPYFQLAIFRFSYRSNEKFIHPSRHKPIDQAFSSSSGQSIQPTVWPVNPWSAHPSRHPSIKISISLAIHPNGYSSVQRSNHQATHLSGYTSI